MDILVLSSLEKVFSDERPSAPEFKSFSMLKNERSSFQVAFCTEKDENVTFEIIKHSDSANIIVEYANDDEHDVTNYVFVGKLSIFERLYDFFADIFERIYEFFFRW